MEARTVFGPDEVLTGRFAFAAMVHSRLQSKCTTLHQNGATENPPSDWRRGRVYLPQEDLRRFAYPRDDLLRRHTNSAFQELIKFEVERARRWLSPWQDESLPELAALAFRAVQRVRTNSELKDLWLEADGLNEWSASLRGLEARLAG